MLQAPGLAGGKTGAWGDPGNAAAPVAVASATASAIEVNDAARAIAADIVAELKT